MKIHATLPRLFALGHLSTSSYASMVEICESVYLEDNNANRRKTRALMAGLVRHHLAYEYASGDEWKITSAGRRFFNDNT